MKIVFFGSDDFAAAHLEALFKSSHVVAACVTSADVRQGRGMKIKFSPIKLLAAEHRVECIQPDSLKDPKVVEQLKNFNADVFVVVAYGKILTQAILDLPKIFCVNVHGSLLPKYRGAAPVNWAVINGDEQTGLTIQKVALELDAGDIIAQTKIGVAPDMNAEILRKHMAEVGAPFLARTLDAISNGKYALTPQDHAKVSYAPKLTKQMAQIDWSRPAQEIYNRLRGLKPWPGTQTMFQGKVLKIIDAQVLTMDKAAKPGIVVAADKHGFCVACGKDALAVKEVQPQAGKVMSAASFMAGHKITAGLEFS